MGDNVSPRWIEVSDSDPSLSYSGTWFLDRDTEVLSPRSIGGISGGTAHGTHTGGVAFEYEGTDVALYGQFSKTPTATALPITCNIDGSPGNMDNFTAYLPGATVRLCFRDGLGLSSHQLVANFTSDSDAIYWVDNLNYMSAPNANLTGKTSRLVATSSAIRYSSASNWDDAWIKGSMFSNSAGASLEADFYGTTITMEGYAYYLFPSVAANATYKIDDGEDIIFPLTRYEYRYRGLAIDQDRTYLYLFHSDPIPLGQHKITVKYNGQVNMVPLTMSAFLVSDGLGDLSNIGTGAPLTNGTLPGGLPPGSTPPESKKNMVPIIAGAAGGAAAVLLFIAFLLFWFWMRKKNKPPERLTAEETTDLQYRTRDLMMATQPYTLTPQDIFTTPNGSSDPTTGSTGSTPQSSKRQLLMQLRQPPSFGSSGSGSPAGLLPPPAPPQPSKRPVQRRAQPGDGQPNPQLSHPYPTLPMRKPRLSPDPTPSSSSQSGTSTSGSSQASPAYAPPLLPMTKPRLTPNTRTGTTPPPPHLPMTKPRLQPARPVAVPGVGPSSALSPPTNEHLQPSPPQPNPATVDAMNPPRAAPLRPQAHKRAVPPPVPRRGPRPAGPTTDRRDTITSVPPVYTFD